MNQDQLFEIVLGSLAGSTATGSMPLRQRVSVAADVTDAVEGYVQARIDEVSKSLRGAAAAKKRWAKPAPSADIGSSVAHVGDEVSNLVAPKRTIGRPRKVPSPAVPSLPLPGIPPASEPVTLPDPMPVAAPVEVLPPVPPPPPMPGTEPVATPFG